MGGVPGLAPRAGKAAAGPGPAVPGEAATRAGGRHAAVQWSRPAQRTRSLGELRGPKASVRRANGSPRGWQHLPPLTPPYALSSPSLGGEGLLCTPLPDSSPCKPPSSSARGACAAVRGEHLLWKGNPGLSPAPMLPVSTLAHLPRAASTQSAAAALSSLSLFFNFFIFLGLPPFTRSPGSE